ncbi:MAG: GldL-related protein [Bacteroidota bacterium]
MKAIKVTSVAACILVIIGAFFNIMHANYGSLILTSGVVLFFIFLGLQSFYRKNRRNVKL